MGYSVNVYKVYYDKSVNDSVHEAWFSEERAAKLFAATAFQMGYTVAYDGNNVYHIDEKMINKKEIMS